MLTFEDIKTLLEEGVTVDIHDYVKGCRVFSAKTFYYFCERLVQEGSNRPLPSPVLRNHILAQVEAAGVDVPSRFNPEGWFGTDWTKRVNGYIDGYCREEYLEILERSWHSPYYYQIRTEKFDLIRDLLYASETPKATDIATPQPAARIKVEEYRILRDTTLARHVKVQHSYKCQICGEVLQLGNGKRYAESHHLKPLGKPHYGPDVAENIICVCPNHHALLDYGAIIINKSKLIGLDIHNLSDVYIAYHNQIVCTE